MMTASHQRGTPRMLRANSLSNLTHGRLRPEDRSFWDRQLRARIGQDLRSIFETSLNEPVPEHVSRPLLQIEMVAHDDTARSQSRNEGPEEA
jgi:hypothetical protein